MRSIILGCVLLFVGLAYCQTNIQVRSIAGGVDAGGGNADIAEFYTIARTVAIHYKDVYSRTSLGVKSAELTNLVKKMTVEEVDKKLYLASKLVEAINYPSDMKIEFNSEEWKAKDNFKKVQLVIHEMLGLLKVPDVNYKVSLDIMSEMYSAGLNFYNGFDKILKFNRPFELKKVECKVFRGYFNHEPFKIFTLSPVNAGFGETIHLTKDVIVEVYFGYGPRVQNRIDLYTKRLPSDPLEARGHKMLASTWVNFIGDSVDMKLESSGFTVCCESID